MHSWRQITALPGGFLGTICTRRVLNRPKAIWSDATCHQPEFHLAETSFDRICNVVWIGHLAGWTTNNFNVSTEWFFRSIDIVGPTFFGVMTCDQMAFGQILFPLYIFLICINEIFGPRPVHLVTIIKFFTKNLHVLGIFLGIHFKLQRQKKAVRRLNNVKIEVCFCQNYLAFQGLWIYVKIDNLDK